MTIDKLKLIPALGWLLMSALFFAGGEYLSKLWGYRQTWSLTAAVVASYALGTLFWLPAMLHKNDLARMGTLWYLLTTPTTIILGVFVFREKLTPAQWTGMGFALVALWLLKD